MDGKWERIGWLVFGSGAYVQDSLCVQLSSGDYSGARLRWDELGLGTMRYFLNESPDEPGYFVKTPPNSTVSSPSKGLAAMRAEIHFAPPGYAVTGG
ncbi:MAG: hypothetical protein ACFCUG_00215 [Thiotrichales bacterium]